MHASLLASYEALYSSSLDGLMGGSSLVRFGWPAPWNGLKNMPIRASPAHRLVRNPRQCFRQASRRLPDSHCGSDGESATCARSEELGPPPNHWPSFRPVDSATGHIGWNEPAGEASHRDLEEPSPQHAPPCTIASWSPHSSSLLRPELGLPGPRSASLAPTPTHASARSPRLAIGTFCRRISARVPASQTLAWGDPWPTSLSHTSRRISGPLS
ncbi:hypothetical protein DFH27DRAFT_631029 [Peziza echinospora]|nr:hypothetical protein DFH27DRAFT_631029 [Peziza echinospora]